MSNHFNDLRIEQLFDEGLEIGLAKGLTGEALDFFAEKYARKHFNKYGE